MTPIKATVNGHEHERAGTFCRAMGYPKSRDFGKASSDWLTESFVRKVARKAGKMVVNGSCGLIVR